MKRKHVVFRHGKRFQYDLTRPDVIAGIYVPEKNMCLPREHDRQESAQKHDVSHRRE